MTAALDPIDLTTVRQGGIDASPPPGADSEQLRLVYSHVLFAAALVLAWFLTYFVFLSGFEQDHDQKQLYGELRTQLAQGIAPVSDAALPGAPVALLNIPGTKVEDVVVVQDVGNEQLQSGPGHLPGTVFPGQEGTSAILGRSMSFGAPFGGIHELRRNQSIQVTTSQGTARYSVIGVRRSGDPMPPAPGPGSGLLTLVTSGGSGALAGLRPSSTIYVDARLTSKAVAGGTTSAINPNLTIMKSRMDTATLAQVALSLQFLALSLAGALCGWRRWSRLGAWIAGVPVVTAALWLTSSLFSRVLPGLI